MIPRMLVCTDLDGTLLDEATYGFEPARTAVAALRARGIPLILCTSKTFAETVEVQAALGISDPFIVENGGGLYFRPGQLQVAGIPCESVGNWRRITLGTAYPVLVARFRALRADLGLPLIGYSDLTVEALARETGLSLAAATRALRREFDEPFRLEGPGSLELEHLEGYVRDLGLQLTQGGRYFHLSGPHDKGWALRLLQGLLQGSGLPLRTIALGDSPNDLPMLEAADTAVIVMRPGRIHHPVLLDRLLRPVLASGVGPEGWNTSVLHLLEES